MSALVYITALLLVGLTIFLILYKPKESYLRLYQLNNRDHIADTIVDASIPISIGDEDQHAYDYSRHNYNRDKRRYNFLNHKNTLYNS